MRELRADPGPRLSKTLRLYTDGASRGNPGPAALGIVITDDQGLELQTLHMWLGKLTNNEAEYRALIEGLKAVATWKPDRLEMYLDSNLLVEQVKGKYRVKKPELRQLHSIVMEHLKQFGDWSITHVERAKNSRADKLANMAIDAKVKKAKSSG